MLEIVLFSIAFVILLIGAYTDIRTREVPDWLNFAGITAGIGIRLLWSLTTNEWSVLGRGILGFIVFFALACLMFYTGQWGGGDSKLLMAFGALLGFGFSRDNIAITFLIWVLFAGAFYGLFSSIILAIKHWHAFVPCYKSLMRTVNKVHAWMIGVLVLGIAFAIASNDSFLRTIMLVIALAIPTLFYSVIGIKAVEQSCMYKFLKPQQLTEGDWVAKPVYFKGKYICGPKDLGIAKEKIQELKRLKIKQVLIKEGIPFVPSFVIAFALSLLIGSPISFFF